MTMQTHSSFHTASIHEFSQPSLADSTASQLIDIPAKRRPSSSHDLPPSLPLATRSADKLPINRKRRDNLAEFRDVQWDLPHHIEPYTLRSPTSSRPATSSAGGKRKDKDANILRRTSASCKNKFQKAIGGRSRTSSMDTMDAVEGQPVLEPTNPFQFQHHPKGFIDRLAHPNRMLSNLKVSRFDTPQPVHPTSSRPTPFTRASSATCHDLHYSSLAFHQIQHDTRAGAAARKAAAAQNYSSRLSRSPSSYAFHLVREQNRRRVGSNSSAADSGADICSSSDIDMPDTLDSDIIQLDPITYLPPELNSLIFSYLDADSLRACQHIPSWRTFACDSLIWRGEYLRSFDKENYVSPAPIQIGGVGVGKPHVKMQDWETMFKAREHINANWEAGRGRAIYMAGHTDSVYCVQFDEQKIITGSRDRTIRVWDINTHRCIKVIGGPSVRPSPGPRVLRTVDYPSFHHAEASVNGTAYGHQIYHVPADFHSASILCLQYDDEILVTGSSDNDLIVWDINTYEPIKRLRNHQGGVLDVAFDSKHIVSCSKDCTIVVWDRNTLLPLRTLTGHNGPVNAVQLRGHLLVSASGDGVARLWDLNKMECVREFSAKERGLAAVEFSDDAKYVLAGGNDHVTYKFEVATGNEILQYSGHSQLVRSLFLDTRNKRVVSGSYDLDLRVYDYDTGRLITVFPEWTTSWMLAAKCDYRRIVSTSQDGRILMIDFGINQDGTAIKGVDLLGGCEPRQLDNLDRLYPKFSHANVPNKP